MRSLLLTAAVLAASVLGGCASSPQAAFYTLSPERAIAPVDTGVAPLAVAIGLVAVPEIVDRPQLVLRVNATQVRIDEFARWAEPLKSQVVNVMVADLAQLLPGARVSSYPQWADRATAYQVAVDIQRFDSAPGDAATVSVLWLVRPPKQGTPVSGRSIVSEPAGAPGYDALVAAHSRALAAVCRDIAAAIRSTGGE
ncbi:hypothetical protein UB46_17845 [Burkholderiaceae bacterium 16]|nr:hypothetical protein UB46_17845 [Burkholderiaceae bacterium 16]